MPYPARVRTLRHAAALLGAAQSIDTLLPIAAELSFEPLALPLDDATRAGLGIPDDAGEACLVRGRGALRALVVCTGRTEPLRVLFTRQISLLGSYMGRKAELLRAAQFFFAGELRPVVDRTFPLADAAEAHRRLELREQFGKLVLVV